MSDQTGRCLCGGVRFRFSGKPLWQGHCHCESCRKGCAAPMTSFIGVVDGAWAWTGEEPSLYESSPGVRRYFCARCGSQMAYAADRFPGETHFYAASLDDPSAYAPSFHVFAAEAVPWLVIEDDLPRYTGTTGTQKISG
ncbi:MAG: GFA family protein [Pseudomonadota bacterium]